MRKKLLSLALLALVACSAWAQEAPTKPIPTFSALADDGTSLQYLYNVDAQAFVLGANDWGTRASVSTDNGYLFKVKNNGNGTWTLNDYVGNTWKAVFAGKWDDIWVDNLGGANVNGWVITLNDDGVTYSITNPGAGEGKLAASGFPDDTRLYLSNDGKYDKWAFVNESDYNEALAQARQSNRPCKDWSLVKNVDAFNSSSNFFALYEKNTGLVLSTKEGNEQSGFKTMTLKADADPTKDKSSLWIVTDNGGNHNITNAEWREFYFQTEWNAAYLWRCSDNGNGDAVWGYVNFKPYTDLTWKIEQNQYKNHYLGPWHTTITEDDEFAGNRSEDEAPAFDIYAISKGKYVAEYEDITNATVSNPIDLNYLIVNASGSYRNMIGWIHNNSFQTQNNNGLANNVGENGRFFEAWQPSGNLSDRKMYQKLTDLPTGKYQISVLTDCEASGAFVYGNINKAELNTKVDGKASVVADVIDGTLEFGVELDGYQSNWVKFDNFELKYLGFDPTEVLNALKAQIDAATFTEKHSAASEAALQTAIADAQALVDAGTGTIAEIEESAGNLSSAVAAVNASINDYKSLAAALSLANNYNPVTPNYTALATAITTAQAIYDEAATESCEATIAALDAAVKAAKVNDYNYVMNNFTEDATLGDWTNTYDTNKKTDEGYDSSTGYYDLWSGNNASPAISQIVTLPAGEYALIGIGRGQAGQSTEKLSVKIGDGEAITVDFLMKGNTGLGVNTSGQADFEVGEGHAYTRNGEGQGWEYRFIIFTLTEQSSVTLGTNATLSNSWAGVYPLQVKTTPESVKALKIIEINTIAATAPNSKMQTSVKSTLDEKLAAAEAATTDYTKEQLQTVYDELKAAIDAANASIENYKALNDLISTSNACYNEAAEGSADFNTAISAATTAYENAETDATEEITAIKNALDSYVEANVVDVVVNGNFDNNKDGWNSTTGASGQNLANNKSGDFTGNFWENWNNSPKTGKMSQTNACVLPAGDYILKIAAFGDQIPAYDGSNLYVFAGNQKTAVVSADPTYYYLPFTLSEDAAVGTVEYGLAAEGGNKSGWLGIDNVTISNVSGTFSFPADIVNGDFEDSYSVVSGTGVSSDRAIYQPNGWTVSYKGDKNDMTILNSSDLAANNFTSITALEKGGNNTYLYRGKWGNNTNIEVYQYVYLPAGTYTLTCDAWKSGLGGDGTIFVGNKTASLDGNATEWRPLKLEYTVTDEYEIVKVGFNIIHNNDGSEKFIGFDNFKICDASATMSVSETAKYGTFIAPFDVTVPEGVKAYSCYVINDNTLDLAELVEPAIPANTPVILYAENGYETTTFYGVNTATEDAYANGYLTGVYADTKAPAGSYVLQNGGNGVKFYVVEEGKEPTVKANRCYLNLPEGSDVKAFGFSFGEVDAINSINADKKQMDGAIYNLNGQRLNSLQKGLNIVNGKKLFIK